ncbi:hypothetical protein VMT65_18470 [Nocardia sp. CDC153]|uniref:hypothetical protein n=1 Tax=Nocardia sp. CDC153 TaxID=3112167 RepID=UPI002DC041E3|nr:hypothetical protein [Nocardia sp. CDC153]MEC3955032.1 hypothetical protein [Nocardia sp. CDC153]
MRSLWFIPHGNTVTEPEESTGYRGGWSSTLHPISTKQAAAVAAHGRRRAREMLSLLEGAGFIATEAGSEYWSETELVGEGFNRFDKGYNGRVHKVAADLTLPGSTSDIALLARRFADLPPSVIERVRADTPDKTYTLFLPRQHGHAGTVKITKREDPPRITVNLLATSKRYFYRWDKREPVWKILLRNQTEEGHEDRRAREIARLGFSSRDWPVHAELPDGISESEATDRVRLYLMGAGVDTAAATFRARRTDSGWDVAISGDPALDALGVLRITDAGRINPLDE